MTLPDEVVKEIENCTLAFSVNGQPLEKSERLLNRSSVERLCLLTRRLTIEECAKVAYEHKGSAYKEISPSRWKMMDEETRQEIRAEERGEDIASEVITAAIRQLDGK